MPLSSDTLLDRIRIKAQVARWRSVAFFVTALLILVIGLKLAQFSPRGEYIARVEINGLIQENLKQNETLTDIAEDKTIKALIVHVDSPGGTVVGGEDLYRGIKEVAAKKPVVVVMGTMATSAAYMASLPAHHILARQGTITGSIGVLLQSAEVVGLGEKLGIDFTTLKSSPLKGIPSPFERLTPEGRASIQPLIDDFYRVFAGMVSENRHLSESEMALVADGRVFTGQQAVANKLIDAIGDEKIAREWLNTEKKIKPSLKIRDVDLVPEENGVEALFSSLWSKNILSRLLPLNGLVAIWPEGVSLKN